MNKNEFWELIQESYREADWETDKQMEILIKKLSKYSKDEILKFGKIYSIYAEVAYKSKLWAAAHIMNGGCKDNCFKYFRGWLISRGKEPYLNAMLNPDSLIDLDIPYEEDNFENEKMSQVSQESFNKKVGTDNVNIYFENMKNLKLKFEEHADILNEISFDEDIDAKWDKHDEESLKNLLPQLYNQYW